MKALDLYIFRGGHLWITFIFSGLHEDHLSNIESKKDHIFLMLRKNWVSNHQIGR